MAGISHVLQTKLLYGLFNKDNLHEVHEGPQYDSFFSRMFLNLYNSIQ